MEEGCDILAAAGDGMEAAVTIVEMKEKRVTRGMNNARRPIFFTGGQLDNELG